MGQGPPRVPGGVDAGADAVIGHGHGHGHGFGNGIGHRPRIRTVLPTPACEVDRRAPARHRRLPGPQRPGPPSSSSALSRCGDLVRGRVPWGTRYAGLLGFRRLTAALPSVARAAWSCGERGRGDHAARASDGLPPCFSNAPWMRSPWIAKHAHCAHRASGREVDEGHNGVHGTSRTTRMCVGGLQEECSIRCCSGERRRASVREEGTQCAGSQANVPPETLLTKRGSGREGLANNDFKWYARSGPVRRGGARVGKVAIDFPRGTAPKGLRTRKPP